MKHRYLAVGLPTALYGGLHLLGGVYPVPLWGVDQLRYYGWSVQASCALLFGALLALGLRDSWLERVEDVLHSWAIRLAARPRLRTWLPRAVLVCLPLVLYAARVRFHTLGDSMSWFAAVEALVAKGTRPPFTWALEPLDFGVHLSLYWLAKHLVDVSARSIYETVSCVAGAGYAYVAYRVACLAGGQTGRRILVLSVLLTLGTIQLFFGYGESYTLAAVGAVAYVWLGMRFLLQRTGWHWPALALLLTCACHLMALSLVPSLAYLMWRDEGPTGRRLRQWRVFLPLVVVAAAGALALYVGFYRHHHLPLLSPDAPGRYPILSLHHFGTLANEALLLSPFGLVWGAMALARPHRVSPVVAFLGWGALGSGALVCVHNITMGGRDWDLMSFPGLFYTLWGLFGLLEATDDLELWRGIRMVMMPALAIHTALWIGINASSTRALDRLENLLQYSNQASHYRQWVQGYFHLTHRKDPKTAAGHFRQARAFLDAGATDYELFRFRYDQYLAFCMTKTGEHREAVALFNQAYANYQARWDANDFPAYEQWVSSLIQLGDEASREGRRAEADSLWTAAVSRAQEALNSRPVANLYRLQGTALKWLGEYEAAIVAFQQGLLREKAPKSAFRLYIHLAEVFQLTGDLKNTEAALAEAVRINPSGEEFVQKLRKILLPSR